MKKETPK